MEPRKLVELAIEAYKELRSVHNAGSRLGVSGDRIWRLLKEHGFKLNSTKWTPDEDELLKSLYKNEEMILDEAAEIIGRSADAISVRVSKLGLKGRQKSPRSLASRKRMSISQKLSAAKPGMSEIKSQRAKDWHMNNEHPRGFAKHKHSESSKKIISKKSKAFNSSLTLVQKKQLTEKAIKTKIAKYGTAAPVMRSGNQYSRTRGGTRADLGFYVRSAWEANYSRYLKWLVDNGQILGWRYEPKTFRFPVKRGCIEYTPDFEVTELTAEIVWHEVKGWMDKKSNTKLKRFAKYYPDQKLVLIGKQQYQAICKTMKSLIPEWE